MPVIWRALILIFLTVFSACGGGNQDVPENRVPDAEDVGIEKISLRIDRFERDLFKASADHFTADTVFLGRRYGSFAELFSSRIIRIGSISQPLYKENLLGFLNDPDIRSVYEEVQKQYPDIEFLREPLTEAMNRYHVLYPDSVVPHVVTMISGFNYNIAVADSTLAIGLDMYLGNKCKFYEWLAMPAYKVNTMHRGQIVADAVRGFLLANFEMKSKEDDLVSWMIYHGKINYTAMQLLPGISEANVMAYSDEQLKWNQANEGRIWSHFIDKKLFYSTDFNDQVNYINDGPFTPGFTKDTPPKMGVWLGLQVVKHYMEKNSSVTIQQLLANQNAHQIFNQSGYKPIRK